MSEHDASSAQPSTPDRPAGEPADTGPGQETAATEPEVADAAAESGVPASAGDPRVDAALTRLDELDRLDVTEHAGVVDAIHRALQDTLAEEEE